MHVLKIYKQDRVFQVPTPIRNIICNGLETRDGDERDIIVDIVKIQVIEYLVGVELRSLLGTELDEMFDTSVDYSS